MGCRKGENGSSSLLGLIFGIISFSVRLAFKIVEIVFQALFGALSGIIGTHSREEHAAGSKQEIKEKKQENNVREFRKPDRGKGQTERKSMEDRNKESVNSNENEKVKNKDLYVVLFILTIIPATVALAMGKLYYAGIIGAAGFGLMTAAGIISGISESIKRNAAEKKAEEPEQEAEEEDSVEKLIKEAFEKLFEIRKDIDKIKDADTRAKIEAVCRTGEKIIGEVRTNPEGLAHVRKFFYYYLDAFGEIVKKYLRLSQFEESSQEVSKLVEEAEKSFADIDAIFRELCEKLLEKDMLHLKAEIDVIRNSN